MVRIAEAPRRGHSDTNPTCLTYIPVPHLGMGFVQSCVSILEHFPDKGLSPILYLPRALTSVPQSIQTVEAIPPMLSAIPYRLAAHVQRPLLNSRFAAAIRGSSPDNTIAYFWPAPPVTLVERARARGLKTVREMINCSLTTARTILDEAYDRLGLAPQHGITEEAVERERDELSRHHRVFASNPLVEASLVAIGISPAKVLSSSFGWTPARFVDGPAIERTARFRALFVGSVGVRKGVPQLLKAWIRSGIDGELVLAGRIEEPLRALVQQHSARTDVKVLGSVSQVGPLYRSADVFVFPTLEEGGPQVTYEAAGCGLPVITTPMGSARLVKNGENGFVVNPFDVDGLAEAMNRMANDADLRNAMANRAARDALDFTYDRVSFQRANALRGTLAGENVSHD